MDMPYLITDSDNDSDQFPADIYIEFQVNTAIPLQQNDAIALISDDPLLTVDCFEKEINAYPPVEGLGCVWGLFKSLNDAKLSVLNGNSLSDSLFRNLCLRLIRERNYITFVQTTNLFLRHLSMILL
jgi:hypothetical protein